MQRRVFSFPACAHCTLHAIPAPPRAWVHWDKPPLAPESKRRSDETIKKLSAAGIGAVRHWHSVRAAAGIFGQDDGAALRRIASYICLTFIYTVNGTKRQVLGHVGGRCQTGRRLAHVHARRQRGARNAGPRDGSGAVAGTAPFRVALLRARPERRGRGQQRQPQRRRTGR